MFLFFAHTTVWAQEPVHRIGFLSGIEQPVAENAFIDGLREHGYLVGRNLHLDRRYTQGEPERIPLLVNELVALRPEIIVANAPQHAIAVHNAAPAIPLVFIAVADPVAIGLVQSLTHPGGNVTGFATVVPEEFVANQIALPMADLTTRLDGDGSVVDRSAILYPVTCRSGMARATTLVATGQIPPQGLA
jgi:ABC-type uncharacterized transport system substrate-binding protein